MASWDKKSKKKNKKDQRSPEPDIVPSHLEEKYGPYQPILEETPNKFRNNEKGPNRNSNSSKK